MSPTKKICSKSTHPSWIDMIKECIAAHADQSDRGVSRPKIKEYVKERYGIQIGPTQVAQLSEAIISGQKQGIFVLPKGPCGKVELALKPRLTRALTKNQLGITTSRPFEFEFCKGAVDLSSANGFISLLRDIRSHLLRSRSTRAVYVAMARKFFSALEEDVKVLCTNPTDQDFVSYIRSNWPTIRSCQNLEEDTLTWGWVEKGEAEKTNKINILSDIVVAAETAAAVSRTSGLSVDMYNLIITVIVLHELGHAFTKFFFHDNVTPKGVGKGSDRNYGESGWLVEEQIMGGRLLVEWVNKKDFGDMMRIDHVLLVNGSDCWELDVNVTRTSLSSLQKAKFIRPAHERMRKHVQPRGSIRARLESSTKRPKVPVKSSVGLGIRLPGPIGSFVGADRRVVSE